MCTYPSQDGSADANKSGGELLIFEKGMEILFMYLIENISS